MNLTFDLEPQDFITGLDTALKKDLIKSEQSSAESIGKKRKSLKDRKRIIKHRYEKPTYLSIVKEENPTKVDTTEKKRSYMQKRYIVRSKRCCPQETSSEDEEEKDDLSDYNSDEPMLALPNID